MTNSFLPIIDEPVTAVISHLVKQGREEGYEAWFHGIAADARKFKGHLGVSAIRPQDHSQPEYVVILKFDQYSNLKVWIESDIRQEWISRLQPLIEKTENIQTLTGLETWFSLPNIKTHPPKYKMAWVSWVAVFSVLSLVSPLLHPITSLLPELLARLIVTGVIVLILTYVVMPRLTQLLRRWLYPKN
jgi:uncharacterized protein